MLSRNNRWLLVELRIVAIEELAGLLSSTSHPSLERILVSGLLGVVLMLTTVGSAGAGAAGGGMRLKLKSLKSVGASVCEGL